MKIRKYFIFALAAALVFLCACSKEIEIHIPAADIANTILLSQQKLPDLSRLEKTEDSTFSAYLLRNYQLDGSKIEDAVIYYISDGSDASELAVFRLSDASAAQAFSTALTEYKNRREAVFSGYSPENGALVKNGMVACAGTYTALLLCEEPRAAQDAFFACFKDNWTPPDASLLSGIYESEVPLTAPGTTGETQSPSSQPDTGTSTSGETAHTQASPATSPTQTQPPADPAQSIPVLSDEYSGEAVLAAWRNPTASREGLSAKSATVLEKCSSVISSIITDSMSEYDKELAIHDYIIKNGSYDDAVHSASPMAVPNPENDNPYGMLIDGKGICSGYTSSFQLFMDMLGIECISVEGEYDGGAHAWNMVRLEGEWYAVDVTWDDPGTATGMFNKKRTHSFFNVTSDFMRDTAHEWNEALTPNATAVKYAWH